MITLKHGKQEKFEWVGMKEQTRRKFKKSGNLSGFLWIGNTKKRTYEKERLIGRRQNLDKLLFESE